MSAFLSIFLSLKRLDPSLSHVALSAQGYFEIEEMLRYHTDLFSIEHYSESMAKKPDIAILDSTTVLPKQHLWSDAKILIIDTTLWASNHPTLKALLTQTRFKGLILLLRSHIKLDCFGLEVNRLGSIVAVKTQDADCDLQMIRKHLHETACNIGCNFNIDDFYPWLFNKEFKMLCQKRTEKIKSFTRTIYAKLKPLVEDNASGFELSKGDHELFIALQFKCDRTGRRKYDFGNSLQRYARSIVSKAKHAGLPIIHGASFGLFCTAIDGHLHRDGNKGYLRLAPSPNMNLAQADKIADFIVSVFQ